MFLFIMGLVAVVIGAIVALVLIAGAVLTACFAFSPSFDEFGQINECIGCQGNDPAHDCRPCRYNPDYWDGTTYIGPSRRELKNIKNPKETKEETNG